MFVQALFIQDVTPLGSLGLSALVAVLPLATVLVLLGVVRMKAHHAALIGLLVALVVGIAAFGMPIVQAVSGALSGAAFGLWPIMWIVVNALWIYRLTVRTGHFDVLRRSFGRISDDPRIQALIIAFCFGALMEALAGFGAPVAISAVMLVAVGFHPVKAAVVALVANTAPVAFGAMGTPVVTLAQVTGLPLEQVSSIVGRQTPLLALVVPLLLVIIVDGKRGLRDTWLPALVCGVAFGLVQFLASNFVSPQLADIGAALAGAAALVALPQTRRPVPEAVRVGMGGTTTTEAPPDDARGDVVKAYLPYGLIIVIFSLGQLPPIKALLDKATWKFHWFGLNVAAPNGKPVSGNTFSLPFLNTGGTLVLIAGIVTAAVLAVSASGALSEWLATVKELRFAILTVTGVLALAYVMNLSGQTSTIGTFIAAMRRRTRVPVPGARLVRRRRLGVRHVGERAVRRAAGDRGPPDRPARGPARRGQQLRRRARQDGLAAEPHHRLRRGEPARRRGQAPAEGPAVEPRAAAGDVPDRARAEHAGAQLDAAMTPWSRAATRCLAERFQVHQPCTTSPANTM